MKILVGCLLFACIMSGVVFIGSKTKPIDVVRKYFELSKNQQIEEAGHLWSNDNSVKTEEPAVISNGGEKYRFDISYSKEISESQYEILDFKEFPKSDNSTVLCLSLQSKGQRKLVFRVELSSINRTWKINNMQNANEDVLAVIHKDCNTVDFK